MFLEFIKYITLSCSILSSSKDYNYNLNLNLIFVEVPNLYLGYEGVDWLSGDDSKYKVLRGDDYSLSMNHGIPKDRVIYQNFGKENVLFFYQKGMYSKDGIHTLLQEF